MGGLHQCERGVKQRAPSPVGVPDTNLANQNQIMNTPTNVKLRAMLQPVLDAVAAAAPGDPYYKTVDIALDSQGTLSVLAWVFAERINAASLAELPAAVAAFNPKAKRKVELEAELAKINAELAKMQ